MSCTLCLRSLWRSRWGLARLVLAGLLLWVFIADNPARLIRLRIASIPELDYAAEVRQLRGEKRYGEALVVADAGLERARGEQREALEGERARVIADRNSYGRRASDFFSGALRGTGRTAESLVGAVAADMFVVGDVRDLLLQGYEFALGGEMDKVILGLSAVGVVSTIMPEFDWTAALLKVARKMGALSVNMSKAIVRICRKAVKTRDYAEIRALTGNVADLSRRASPAGTLRLLQYLDDPKELSTVADFVRQTPDGAFALHMAGKEGVSVVRTGSKEAKLALREAARKGPAGLALFRVVKTSWRRPHPLFRLVKPFYKGNVPASLQRFVSDYLDPYGFISIPLLAGWAVLEVVLLLRRFLRSSRRQRECLARAAL